MPRVKLLFLKVTQHNQDTSDKKLITRRRAVGGFLGIIGFLLSPLSWWNDAFINLPLAVAFGWLVSLAYKPAFEPAVVVGYWLTNVAGFVLMHKGAAQVMGKEQKKYSKKDLLRDLGTSLAYTLLIVMLIKFKVLQPIGDYFSRR